MVSRPEDFRYRANANKSFAEAVGQDGLSVRSMMLEELKGGAQKERRRERVEVRGGERR